MTPPASTQALHPAQAADETTVLVVPGMHCAGCMAKVERALRAVPGVASARVNLTARQVGVEHAAEVTMPQLMDALGAVGCASQPRGADLAPPPSAVKPLLTTILT